MILQLFCVEVLLNLWSRKGTVGLACETNEAPPPEQVVDGRELCKEAKLDQVGGDYD
jgi:hypothetical protein